MTSSSSQAGLPFSPVAAESTHICARKLAGGLLSPVKTLNEQWAERIYALYPRKVGRPKAIQSIIRAAHRFGFDTLERQTKAYAEAVATKDPQFIPHPTTWFNQQRFNDDPATWNPSSSAVVSKIDKVVALEEYRLCQEEIRRLKASYDSWQTWTEEDRTKLRQVRQRLQELKQQLGMKI